MRISDWSSDVCSSDLLVRPTDDAFGLECERIHRDRRRPLLTQGQQVPPQIPGRNGRRALRNIAGVVVANHVAQSPGAPVSEMAVRPFEQRRSEEHTSELQSLMRISYAVFCLKKKTNNK